MTRIHNDYDYALDVLRAGTEVQFKELEHLIDDFPNGVDGFLGRRWIINAIDCGSIASVAWMISSRVELRFKDEEGYTVLHSALERTTPDRYDLLELLLQHGASIDAHGINDWTPAHMAAVRDDVAALKLLHRFGANFSIRTRIDSYATPLEEANSLGIIQATQFLKSIT